MRLTSGVLGEAASKRIRTVLGLDEGTALRIEIEPSMIIHNIKEVEGDNFRLIDTDNINYAIRGTSKDICVLSSDKGEFDEDGKWHSKDRDCVCDNWKRHSLTAPSVDKAIISYLDTSLFDDVSLPLVEELIKYYNS